MRGWIGSIALLLAAVLPSQDDRAQQATAPEPIVQVTIDPPRVVVGQQTTLAISVMAPNYMTSPPELPGFQVRNAVTRQLQSVNTNEQRDGVSYAGVRFEYAISPQEPGSYAVADQSVRIKYAAEPPATREVTVALPPVSFEAFIPDAARALQPFVSADSMTAEQEIRRSSDQLKAGDAVTRTVTIKAEGTPAMLLPPQQFPAIEGLRLYPAQPKLEDRIDGRTDVMTSTRVDSATYMLERPGDYALPAVEIGWWNNANGKVERIHLDAVPLAVAATAGASQMPTDRSGRAWTWSDIRELVADHWLIVLLAAVIAACLGLIAPRAIRRIAADHRRRHEAYRRSEMFAFNRLRRAIRHRDAGASYFALLEWLPHLNASPPSNTAGAFKVAARDPELDRQIGALESELFANRRDPAAWSPRQLLHRVVAARRSLRPRARHRDTTALPQHLNPVGTSNAAAYRSRKPAR
ncbi:BatD family protein [Bradyrhizobium sp. CCGUVB1N3]|uniref:BatD family protein n=1 Tax=Bradyrhizobium sp. CCGUVB1N3 TaxID=2949629 RepID=UPI0020B24F7A|nr:BatD family protein [Bradyrhizobium sp. CCGUVB1N3]MCP3476576.1 BatD family protein [Bradyrhizobium sp. CCGUVB1N3]